MLVATYRRGIIGKRDRTLDPMIPPGSIVHIDTRERSISTSKSWAHDWPIYFLMTRDGYVCGWCELDGDSEWLTLIPHPLSPAPSRRWKYRTEIENLGRVVVRDDAIDSGWLARGNAPGYQDALRGHTYSVFSHPRAWRCYPAPAASGSAGYWWHPARQMCPVPQDVGRDAIADNSSWEPDLRAPVITLARFPGRDRLMGPYR